MTINEFAKKYNLGKRTVDYFTNKGIFHPKKSESDSNVYRDYDERCEKEAEIVVICVAAGMKTDDISAWCKTILYDSRGEIPKMMKKFLTELITAERNKVTKLYDDALRYIDKH